MRNLTHALLFIALTTSAGYADQTSQAAKHRIAVLDFNYGTVMSSSQAGFGTNQDIGKGISDLLIDRLISVNSGEILGSVTGKGESTRSGTNLLGGGAGGGTYGGGAAGMNSANFGQTIIGEAVTQAVTQLAQGLEQKNASIPTATRAPIDGLVADATGSEITINV